VNRRLQRIAPSALVVTAALLVYANALWNGFALDDVYIVQSNTRVQQLGNLDNIWFTPYWPFFGTELGLYRPLAIFLYAVQWAMAGNSPWFFHAVNLLLHALVSLLAFRLLSVLTSPQAALAGALLFAVHPVHTEAVANVVGQAELIAGVTTLGACLLHATRRAGPDVGWGRRVGLVLLFVAGVLAKESAIVLPGLLVALDFYQRRVTPQRAAVVRYARAMALPFFLFVSAAIAYFAVRVDVLGSIGGIDAAPNLPFLRQQHRVLVACRAWVEYIRLLIFPADLSVDYSPGVILPVDGITPMVALGAVIFLAIAMIALMTPWFPRAGLPAAWLIITALPASNLLIPIGVVVAERLVYTPSFAASLVLALAWHHAQAAQHRMPRIAMAGAAAVILAMGVRTFLRNPDWKSTETVWHSLIRDHPESYRAQWNNATLMFRKGHMDLGQGYMELAYQIWPNDAQLMNELAFVYLGRARFDSAAALLERSREITAWVPRTHVLLAQAYVGAGRYDDAVHAARTAMHYGASRNAVFPLLAQAHEGAGRWAPAIAAWRAALRGPVSTFWNYWARYARALARYGLTAEAAAAADSSIARIPAQDTSALRIGRTLRAGISAGCYAPAGPSVGACEDPLAGWKLLAPIQTVEIARDSQNATAVRR
jgi:Tfp pilus assembly protein PilF